MSRELRQLLAELTAKQAESTALMAKEGVTTDELNAKLAEIKAAQAKIEVQKAIDSGRKFDANGVEITAAASPTAKSKEKSTHLHAFLNAVRRRATPEDMEVLNALTPEEPEDGGYIIPEDIQTAINQYKRELLSLKDLVTVNTTTASKGSRVYEKIATMAPLTKITDLTADIADMGSPKFEVVTFAIEDYAGIMSIPNDLLNDTDQNLMNYIAQWIAHKSVVTSNSLINAVMVAVSATAFADYKAIKKAYNITLDPMIAGGSVIVTNQDGYQYLDTLEDGDGKPLLQPMLTDPTKMMFGGKQVLKFSNSTLPTTGSSTKLAPMYVGNFKEAIHYFEKGSYQIDATNVGGTAFIKNQTQVRVIEREDVVAVDTGALIHGTVDVTAVVA